MFQADTTAGAKSVANGLAHADSLAVLLLREIVRLDIL